tara:strand:- start:6725 stop:7750 length:1026 start_codon:yes stop_codon:yes gene_type:complete
MAQGIYDVLFVSTDDLESGSDYDGIPSGQVGIFNPDTGSYLSASESFLQTNFGGDTATSDTTDVSDKTLIVPQRFQIVQGRDIGNPWCSPIINAEDVMEISHAGAAAATAASSTVDLTGATFVVGEIYSFKLVVKGLDTSYQSFVDPSDNERVSYVGQVINFERTATATAVDTEAAAAVVEFNEINDMPFTASYDNATDVLTFTADDEGVDFDLLVDFSGVATPPTSTTVTNTRFDKGVGDGKYVLGHEKRSQGYWGYHNRMYLPQSPKLYADSSLNYDMITLTFNLQNRGHSNPWLFTGENRVNIAVLESVTPSHFEQAFGIADLDGSSDTTVIYKKFGY